MGAAATVVVIRRKQRDIVEVFQGARATSPDRARIPDELGVDQNLVFNGLVRRAVLREAGGGRYYVDEPSWVAMNTMRRRRAIGVLLVLVLVAAVAFIIPLLFIH